VDGKPVQLNISAVMQNGVTSRKLVLAAADSTRQHHDYEVTYRTSARVLFKANVDRFVWDVWGTGGAGTGVMLSCAVSLPEGANATDPIFSSNRSVRSPWAETTAITRFPFCASCTNFCAARLIRWASATDVPPNFATISIENTSAPFYGESTGKVTKGSADFSSLCSRQSRQCKIQNDGVACGDLFKSFPQEIPQSCIMNFEFSISCVSATNCNLSTVTDRKRSRRWRLLGMVFD
jgi:hypothetical protein